MARTGSKTRQEKTSFPAQLNFISDFFRALGKPLFQGFFFLVYLILVGIALSRHFGQKLWGKMKSTCRRRQAKVLFQRLPTPSFRWPAIKIPSLKPAKIKLTLPKIILPYQLLGLGLGIFFSLFTSGWLFFTIFKDLPSPQRLSKRNQSLTTKIYDREGRLLYKVFRDKNRTPVSIKELPTYVIQATIAIEDKDFYRHRGLSLTGIIRAAYQNIVLGKKTGGSTITQQLIKNALLTSEKTWKRKIKEAVLAVLVEKIYSKDEILEMYLNEVGYGGSVYGIEEAAEKYFGKHAHELNLAEASLLAGLPASPSRYSPFGPHPEVAKDRQAIVLKRMVEDGYITEQQREETLDRGNLGHGWFQRLFCHRY